MQNAATISKGVIGEHAKVVYGNFSVWKPLSRLRRFIETADWDKGHILNTGIDSACRCLLVAAFTCFFAHPILSIFMK
jgi:hypothetical protein